MEEKLQQGDLFPSLTLNIINSRGYAFPLSCVVILSGPLVTVLPAAVSRI